MSPRPSEGGSLISDTILAAIIGGLLSGTVILGGVLVGEYLTRQRERWARMESAMFRLGGLHGALEAMLRQMPSREALRPGAPLPEVDREARALAFELRELARRGRRDRDRALVPAIDEYVNRLSAAYTRYVWGTPLNDTETIGTAGLIPIVFPDVNPLGDRYRELLTNGLPSDQIGT